MKNYGIQSIVFVDQGRNISIQESVKINNNNEKGYSRDIIHILHHKYFFLLPLFFHFFIIK